MQRAVRIGYENGSSGPRTLDPGLLMTRDFYAHSLPDKPSKDWQRLEAHLANVAEMASSFFETFLGVMRSRAASSV
jgi:hypothetical protein